MLKQVLRGASFGIVLAALAVGVFLFTVDGADSYLAQTLHRLGLAEATTTERQTAAPSATGQSKQWTAQQWRSRVDGQYRLPPDRRYLIALRWLRNATVRVDPLEAGWRVVAGEAVDTLPERPDFPSLYGSLVRAAWPADHEPHAAPRPSQAVPLHVQRLLSWTVGSADARRMRKHPGRLVRVAAATARLLLVTEDSLEIGDDLAARAMATLALAEGAGAAMPLERSIVAWRLGYEVAARRIAEAELPANAPWRAWLENRPTPEPDSALAVYLDLRRQASRREDMEQWWRSAAQAAERDDIGPLVVLLSGRGLGINADLVRYTLVPFAAYAAATGHADTFVLGDYLGFELARRARESGSDDWNDLVAATLRRAVASYRRLDLAFGAFPIAGFERALEERAADALHPVVLRSIFYGAVDRTIDVRLFRQDNIDRAEQLIDALKTQPGAIANALAVLYSQQMQAVTGKLRKPGPLLKELRRLPLGPRPLWRTLHSALERSSWREGVRKHAFERYAGMGDSRERESAGLDRFLQSAQAAPYPRRFDSRPVDRRRLLSHARTTLYRPLLAESLRDSVVAVEGAGGAPALALDRAREAGDIAALAALAETPGLSRAWRARAARTLAELGETVRADVMFATLVDADPGDWDIREEWIASLRDRGEHSRARRLAYDWRHVYGGERGSSFDVVDALIVEADSALAEGDTELAVLRMREALGQTGAAREYRLAIRVLIALGRESDARDVALRLHARYGRSLNNLLPLVGSYWCLGDYVTGARALLDHPASLTHFDWRDEISPEFARCLSKRPPAAGQAAAQLQKAGADPLKLRWLAAHLHDDGHAAAAFAVIEQLRASNARYQIMIDIDGYRYLEAAQGEQRAFEWIESRVPPAWRGPVSEVIYWKGHHELLWSLVPDDFSKASHRDAVWFMRAMTLAVGRAYTDDRLRRARQYLSEGGETRYADFGRVVLGLASVESLSQRPVGDRALVETTYALAVRAVADGRPRDALRWFHACAAAGERYRGQVEYKWAREVLARAAVGGRPETLLQRHGADYFMPWGVEGLSVRR